MCTSGVESKAAMIRPCTSADAADVAKIYNHYVRETVITFEEKPVSAAEMARRIEEIGRQFPWLVWEETGMVVAYAYASRWKSRSAYRFSVESTVYVATGHHGRRIGSKIYGALLEELRGRGVHTAVGGIALPNPASVALHERLGFKKIAQFAEVGWKFDRWVDVGYWQLIL
jgi:phosphinothricin acetyltransferase